MKHSTHMRLFAGILAASMLTLAGCGVGSKTDETTGEGASDVTTAAQTGDDTAFSFSYSEGLDNNGHWEGVTALDHVQLCKYNGIEIPESTHKITDDAVQNYIKDEILSSYTTTNKITDKAIADGDTVNIDYVGSVDGVEFENGSTNGTGTDVTIGVTSYIDDFIEQLIGHKPGENFDIEVTFPDPYQNNPDLAGKDAVFNITINHISETVYPEVTDAFVAENLTSSNGWTTVEQMETETFNTLQKDAITKYVQDYLMDNSTISSTPDLMIKYQENSMLAFYQQYADMYSIGLEEFITQYVGFASSDEMKSNYLTQNTNAANFYLILQAIAENEKITVNKDDVAAYFAENFGSEDYSQYETNYGMPFLLQNALCDKILNNILDSVVLK